MRREDIGEALGSDWPNRSSHDEGIQKELHAQIGAMLGLDPAGFAPPCAGAPEAARGPDEARAGEIQDETLGEFEFRLFSTAGSKAKVTLPSGNEARGEGGLVAARLASHYLAPEVPAELRRQYELAAVSGDDVLVRSRQRSWGLELPWKVTRVAATVVEAAGATPPTGAPGEGAAPAGRKRPGKKTRIALRNRDRARRRAEAAAAERRADKEAHLKDKRKRLNRTKKLRRRAKEREKKAGAAKGPGEDGGSASESDGPG